MLFGSPVPTHTTSEFDGATATAPTEPVRTESKTGAQVTPALVDFHTPPVAVGGVDHAADSSARRLGVVGHREVGDAAAHDRRTDRAEDERADEDGVGGERVVR